MSTAQLPAPLYTALRHRQFLFLLPLFLLTACKPLVLQPQPRMEGNAPLRDGESVGQTFVASLDGLDGFAVAIQTNPPNSGTLHLTLHPDAQAISETIREASIEIEELQGASYARFRFEPLSNSNGRYYYAKISYQGEEVIDIATAAGDAYLHGALYINDQSQDAQTTHRLLYDPGAASLGILKEFFGWLLILVQAALLYVLPGWALLGMVIPHWASLHWSEKLGLSCGASLAVYPILFLWTEILGIHLGAAYTWIPIILSSLAILWRNQRSITQLLHARRQIFSIFQTTQLSYIPKSKIILNLSLLVAICLVVFTRLWAIRELDLPLFGDSVQHSIITQLLVDNHGLFTSWQPFAELTTFTYHFGFHSAAAAFTWLSGLSSPQSVLWVGQILNILAVLALIPLATRMSGGLWGAVVTILVAGLLVPSPMFYTNWGRYTQLAGQVILPSFMYMLWLALDQSKVRFKLAILAGFILGGLALTHYRILIVAVAFIAACGLVFLRKTALWRVIQTLGISSLIGAGLFVPWFSRLTGGNMFRVFKMQISTPPDQMPAVTRQFNALGDLTFFLPAGIWAVLIAAIVWLLLRRVKGAGLFVIWCGILILIGNPAWLNLPGTGVVNNFTLLIAAYIPAGLFIGVAGESVWAALTGRLAVSRQRLGSFLGGLVLCALLLLGLSSVTDRIDDIQPGSYTLATRPDLRAMQWIQENTLPQSKFLVNSFLAFGDSVAVGADAGWWVPMLAGRKTTLPPINQGYEAGPSAGYRQEIIQLTRAVQTLGVTNSDVLELLYQQGVSHIFIGQQQGKVNNAGSVLDPAVLLSSPAFTPVYHQDRVWIFKILGTDD